MRYSASTFAYALFVWTCHVQAQYCGAQCVSHTLDLLAFPRADLVALITQLNGSAHDTLPSYSDLAEALQDRGVTVQFVEPDILAAGDASYTAIMHVNGNHFVVHEGAAHGLHSTWWGPGRRRSMSWSELRVVTSPIVMVVSSDSPARVTERIANSRRSLNCRLWIYRGCLAAMIGPSMIAVLAQLRSARSGSPRIVVQGPCRCRQELFRASLVKEVE